MSEMTKASHHHTPVLQAEDPRGLLIRSIAFCRTSANDEPEARVNRSSFDAAGRRITSSDPRLWADQAPANLISIYSLSGQPLYSDSVDAGWRLSLLGEGGQILQRWDGRGTVRLDEYDELLRPTAVFEEGECVERLVYGGADLAAHNQCGQLIQHDDPAGTRLNSEFALTGEVIEQTQHCLNDVDTSHWQFNPLGEAIGQTDAVGNIQRFAYTVAGQLKAGYVQLKDQPEQLLIDDIRYDAQGRVESETAGNGVISSAHYRGEDGRLSELKSIRSGGEILQDLTYGYDPVGNVIRIEDLAQPTRYFANQRVDPVSTYQYDTLYQLIEATGREAINQGPELTNYTQTYRYDAGGNMQRLTHVGAQNHSQIFVTSRTSNHTLLVVNDQPPDETAIAAAFDANGNLLELQAGQELSWDRRNQLQQVRPVVRESGNDDTERYLYDASGQRMRKVRTTQAKAVTHTAEVRYLPGLEIRTDSATGETLHVITAQAGRNSVRVLHWQSGKPNGLENDQVRYTLNDHLGSCTLELDNEAQIISQESYYPFGGTSCWAGRNAIEAGYKTVRYSGKERDATGLYYYGLRYYAPWLQRWINPDPAGAVDGLSLFCFVKNNPCSGFDNGGLVYQGINDLVERKVEKKFNIKYRGIGDMKQAGEHDLVLTLDIALAEGLEGMKAEVARLRNNDVANLYRFLGAQPPGELEDFKKVARQVASGYEKIIKTMSRFQEGGDLRDQFVLVERAKSGRKIEDIFVMGNDQQKRIFITEDFRALNIVSKLGLLIHEVSHLELITNDEFYYEGFDTAASLSSSIAVGYQEFSVKTAVQKNIGMRASYKSFMHGFKRFETWLTQVADFWGIYIVAQINPEKSAALHGVFIDRFDAATDTSNSSSFAQRGRRRPSNAI